MIFHLIECWVFDCFKSQMCLLSSVPCFRFSFWNELVWFKYLVLDVPFFWSSCIRIRHALCVVGLLWWGPTCCAMKLCFVCLAYNCNLALWYSCLIFYLKHGFTGTIRRLLSEICGRCWWRRWHCTFTHDVDTVFVKPNSVSVSWKLLTRWLWVEIKFVVVSTVFECFLVRWGGGVEWLYVGWDVGVPMVGGSCIGWHIEGCCLVLCRVRKFRISFIYIHIYIYKYIYIYIYIYIFFFTFQYKAV